MSALETPRLTRRPWFLGLARRYVRSRMRRTFDGVYLEGAESVRKLVEARPLIIAANHVAWWDPLFAVRIDEAIGTTSYALMDEANLARMSFFGWVGAIPIDRMNAKRSLRQLRGAASLLGGPRDAVWIFPQGTQRPAHLRPLDMKGGVAVLAEQSGAAVLPLSVNYLFRQTERPAALATFGEPIELPGSGRRQLASRIEAAIEEGLARIDRFVTTGEGEFEELSAPLRRGDAPRAARLLRPFGSTAVINRAELKEANR